MRLTQRDKRQTGILIADMKGRKVQIPLFSDNIIREVRDILDAHNAGMKGLFEFDSPSKQAEYLLRSIWKDYSKSRVLPRSKMDQLRAGLRIQGYISDLCYYG